jgi:hypothetical protein
LSIRLDPTFCIALEHSSVEVGEGDNEDEGEEEGAHPSKSIAKIVWRVDTKNIRKLQEQADHSLDCVLTCHIIDALQVIKTE